MTPPRNDHSFKRSLLTVALLTLLPATSALAIVCDATGLHGTAGSTDDGEASAFACGIGNNTSAATAGAFSSAVGTFNTASGSDSSAVGRSNTASGNFSSAFGFQNNHIGSVPPPPL